MKLVIFGLTVSSSWGNGHATLWRGLLRSLVERGHRVVFFERDVPYYASHRDYFELPGGKLVLYEDWEQNLALAKSELADADVGMVTSYCPDALKASALLFDSPARLRTFYDLDTPVTLDALASGKPVAYIPENGFRDFDLVLSYTGGDALKQLVSRLGARRVAPLYGHVDPEAHHRVEAQPGYQADLSYLGTYAEDRQGTLQRLFIEPARRLPDKRFLIGGALYPQDFPWTPNIYFVRHVSPGEHPAFYSSSRLTVNVTRAAMAQMGYCPSGRLFEAAACGCPILSDSWQGLEEFFEPGKEILLAQDTQEALQALELGQAELQRIAKAALERTLEQHTATRRATQLEELLQHSPPLYIEA